MSERPDLDALASEITDLAWRVQHAREELRRAERDNDARALRNFMALAPFANPELLPPLHRFRSRRALRRRRRPTPQGLPYQRRPPEVP